jgi:hypothetical protein
MSPDAETRCAPCVNEQISLVPAVKANAEGGGFQKPVHLREGRFEPLHIVVIGDRAAVTRAIAGDVGRIGNDKIDAAGLHPAHDLDAIALQYATGCGFSG